MRTGTLSATGDIYQKNNWRDIFSATEPTTKTNTLWTELDGSGVPLYGWPWFWNGTYWLSPLQRYQWSFQGATIAQYFACPVDTRFNYFINQIRGSFQAQGSAGSPNGWNVTLYRRNSSNADTQIGSAMFVQYSTSYNYSTAINTHINQTSTDMQVLWLFNVPTGGTPGSLFGAGDLLYHLARK